MSGNGTEQKTTNRLKTPTARAIGVFQTVPHSVEAEQGVLGSILIDPVSIFEAQEHLSPEHFYVPAHRVIWDVLVDCLEKKKAVDLITFTQELRDRNLLDSVGGPAFVTNLFTFVPTSANILYYIEILRDKFILRRVIGACTEAVRRSYEEQDEVNLLLDEVEEQITSIALGNCGQSPLVAINDTKDGNSAIQDVIDEMESAHKHRGRTQGLATGFHDFDRTTSGLHPGELVVLAARPSMGKTALAMNIAEHVALRRGCSCGKVHDSRVMKCAECETWNNPGHPVAVFSLETSRHRLVRRMVCGRAKVSLQKIRNGHFKESEIQQLIAAASKLSEATIYIDDTPSLRIFDFKSRARYAVVSLGVKLIIVDYVQLMTTGAKAAANPYERSIELTRVSQTLKEVARELNVAIIALAQLNREAEKNTSGRPRMSNLRECGALEQDADVVALIWRQEYYEEDEDAKKECEGEAELIIAKHKDGAVGTIPLTFLKEFTKFESRTKELYTNDPDERQEGYNG